MTWLGLVIVTLAVMRVTRLVVADDITEPLRQAVTRRWPYQSKPMIRTYDAQPITETAQLVPQWPTKLLACQWCVSFWLSLAGALLAHASGVLPTWTEFGWGWPAIAGGAGLLGMIWS